MPTEYSNFTMPDARPAPPLAPGVGAGNVWDPHTGKWINSQTRKPVEQLDQSTLDIQRARQLAGEGQLGGPEIDQRQSNQSRGIQMGALGVMRDAAEGRQTRTDTLGRELSNQENNSTRSMAASVRGGAMARAAASRAGAAQIGQDTGRANQQIAAQRAANMASARGQYGEALGGMRSDDLAQASSQANLNVGQRNANHSREQFQERMAFDIANAANDDMLGKSAADRAASNADRANGNRSEADKSAGFTQGANIVVGGVNGGIQAGTLGSDERMKTSVHAMSPKARVKERAKYDRSMFKREGDVDIGPDRHTEMLKQLAKDTEGADPYASHNDDRGIGGARHGYAKSREGQDGALFGGRPDPAPTHGTMVEMAPGSVDSMRGDGPVKDEFSRQIMMSDPAAKQEAYALGRAHGATSTKASPVEWAYDMPDDIKEPTTMSGPRGHAKPAGGKASSHSVAKAERAAPKDEPGAFKRGADALVQHGGPVAPGFISPSFDAATKAPEGAAMAFGRNPAPTTDLAAQAMPPAEQPMSPAGGQSPGYFGQLSARTRAMLSDEETKSRVVPLSEEGGIERHWDADVSKAKSAPDAISGASLSGPAPKYSKSEAKPEAPKPAKPRRAPKRTDDDDLKRMADEMLGSTRAKNDAFLGAGPSVGHAPPAWLSREMGDTTTSDERAKSHEHESPMADANRSMAPSSYEYKPEFTPPDQRPGEKNVGPMANHMEADPVAKTAIVKDPGTGLLSIDKTKALKLTMGGLASLQREVDELRERKRA